MWLPSQVRHICIVGGGNAAQVLAALLGDASNHGSGIRVSLLAPFFDECDRLTAAASSNGGITVDNPDGSSTTGMPDLITSDPSAALVDAQLVLLPLPLFAIPSMCTLIAPHLARDAWVGLLPAQGGVQWVSAALLGLEKDRSDVKLFGVDKLPYNCRTIEYGKRVRVFGYKERLGLASIPNEPALAEQMAITVSAVLPRLELFTVPNFLVATLAPSNQCIHPARMYSLFKDVHTREQVPMFYDMNDDDAGYIKAVSDEIQKIARGLEKAARDCGEELDLSGVLSVGDAVLLAYDDVKDTSSLAKIFSSCTGFEGIGTPMKKMESDGKTMYEVDWGSRYFTEDIPALCVLHGLAEIVGEDVPMIDRLIRWAQPHMKDSYEFLTEEGKLNKGRGKIMFTPQYWGITRKEQLVNFHVGTKRKDAEREKTVPKEGEQ